MTELEAKRAAEILRPDFPVAEAVECYIGLSGIRTWAVRTYGLPPYISNAAEVAKFICDKITPDSAIDADHTRQDQEQAAKQEMNREG